MNIISRCSRSIFKSYKRKFKLYHNKTILSNLSQIYMLHGPYQEVLWLPSNK